MISTLNPKRLIHAFYGRFNNTYGIIFIIATIFMAGFVVGTFVRNQSINIERKELSAQHINEIIDLKTKHAEEISDLKLKYESEIIEMRKNISFIDIQGEKRKRQ